MRCSETGLPEVAVLLLKRALENFGEEQYEKDVKGRLQGTQTDRLLNYLLKVAHRVDAQAD